MNDTTNKNTDSGNAYALDHAAVNLLETVRSCRHIMTTAAQRGIPEKDFMAALDFFDKFSENPPNSPDTVAYTMEVCVCAYYAGLEQGRAEHRGSVTTRGEGARQ